MSRPPFKMKHPLRIRFALVPSDPDHIGLWWVDIYDMTSGKYIFNCENRANLPRWETPIIYAGVPSLDSSYFEGGGVNVTVNEISLYLEDDRHSLIPALSEETSSYKNILNRAHRLFYSERYLEAANVLKNLLTEEAEGHPELLARRSCQEWLLTCMLVDGYEKALVQWALQNESNLLDPAPYSIMFDILEKRMTENDDFLYSRLKAIICRHCTLGDGMVRSLYNPSIHDYIDRLIREFSIEISHDFFSDWMQLIFSTTPGNNTERNSEFSWIRYYAEMSLKNLEWIREFQEPAPVHHWMRADSHIFQAMISDAESTNQIRKAEEEMKTYYKESNIPCETLEGADFRWEEFVHSLKHFVNWAVSTRKAGYLDTVRDGDVFQFSEEDRVILRNALSLAKLAVEKSGGEDPEALELLAWTHALNGDLNQAREAIDLIGNCPAVPGGPQIRDLPVLEGYYKKELAPLREDPSAVQSGTDISSDK